MMRAINFFQTIFSFNDFQPAVTANIHGRRLANDLIADAKKLAAEADREMSCGMEAREFSLLIKNDVQRKNMTIIADWHFGRAFEKYQRSVERYSEAGRIPTRKSGLLFAKAKETARYADRLKAENEFKG